MSETVKAHPKPWLPSLYMGAAFLLVGGLPMLILWRDAPSRPGFLTICLVSCVIGLVISGKGWARYRGTLVEKRVIRRLRLPEGWVTQANVPLKRGGDLDLLVVDPARHRYAVEIKSYQGVMLKRTMFGGKEELRYRDGRPFTRDPVEQVLRAAEETDAFPVLWLPEAASTRTIYMKCGLQVVQGSSKNLMKAIGAKRKLF